MLSSWVSGGKNINLEKETIIAEIYFFEIFGGTHPSN